MTKEFDQLCLSIPCDWCQVHAGSPCVNRESRPLRGSDVHTVRRTTVWTIYNIGYRKGRRSMKEEIQRDGSTGEV
jgi:hypothetical protein